MGKLRVTFSGLRSHRTIGKGPFFCSTAQIIAQVRFHGSLSPRLRLEDATFALIIG